MNTRLAPKLRHLVASLTVFVFVTVASLGHLAAQSAATLPAKVDGDVSGLSVELTSVQKTGDTITVRFKYINSSDKGIYMQSQIGGQVDDKIYYVDAKNKKKYLVIRDTEDQCISKRDARSRLEGGRNKRLLGKISGASH